MRFKIDENLPSELRDLLRKAGHDAATVVEQGMGGRSDDDVAGAIEREGRAIVSLDTDFADIRRYPPARYRGIIVLRVGVQERDHIVHVFRGVLPLLDREPLEGRLWIVDEVSVRIRE